MFYQTYNSHLKASLPHTVGRVTAIPKKTGLSLFLLLVLMGPTLLGQGWLFGQTTLSQQTDPIDFLTTSLEDDRAYLHLPKTVLETPILWTRQIGDGKYAQKEVKFTRRGNRILLKTHRVRSLTGVTIPIPEAPKVEQSILAVFPISKETLGPKGHRLDITGLLLSPDIPWLHGTPDPILSSLSFVEARKDWPNEVMIKTMGTMAKKGLNDSRPIYYSFYRLPKPMVPRAYDFRMGFYLESLMPWDRKPNPKRAAMTRWRLEKGTGAAGRPIRPITFYLSPEIPQQWKTYVTQGIQAWSAPFRSAGFEEALVVKDEPEMDEWDQHRIGRSMVRWGRQMDLRGNEDNGSANAHHVIDKRTGEIIKSDIIIRTSMQFLADTYFVRCAPLDERAHAYPFPDSLLGQLVERVVAHEAGHAIGIMDNHYGEHAYPFEKMRDREWLSKMGHTPSIMSYARHNNLVQPQDGIPPSLLIQKVGPMDHYYIQWAYTPFQKGMDGDNKAAFLEDLIALQDSIPWYRYTFSKSEVIGPAMTDEVVENDHPIESTDLALKNLKRTLALLPKVNAGRKDNGLMLRLYQKSLKLWHDQMKRVLSLVGGYDIDYTALAPEEKMYSPIARESQQKAVIYWISHALSPPTWLSDPTQLSGLSYSSYPDKLLEYQQRQLFELMGPQRWKRIGYLESAHDMENLGKRMLSDIRMGLFHGIGYNETGQIDPRRKELQLTFIEILVGAVTQKRTEIHAESRGHVHTDWSKGLFMETLDLLKAEMEKAATLEGPNTGHYRLSLLRMKDVVD